MTMTPEQEAKCREAFEDGTRLSLRKEMYDGYADPFTKLAWEHFKRGAAWSAAQAGREGFNWPKDVQHVVAFAFYAKLFPHQIVRYTDRPNATQRAEFDRTIGKKAADLLLQFPEIPITTLPTQPSSGEDA